MLVAHFQDIGKPTIKIIVPSAKENFASAAFFIEGTASDNVGVAAVYYNLNGNRLECCVWFE